MNLSKKSRAIAETALETVLGLAAGTPVALATTGTSQTVGTGAVVLAVSVFVTNLVQVPAVERFLDRVLGKGGEAQLVSLARELQDVEAVLGEHVSSHQAPTLDQPSSFSSSVAAVAASAGAEPAPTAGSPTGQQQLPADPIAEGKTATGPAIP